MMFSKKTNGRKTEFKYKRNCARGNGIGLENTNKAPNFDLKSGRTEYNVYIETCCLLEVNKTLNDKVLR